MSRLVDVNNLKEALIKEYLRGMILQTSFITLSTTCIAIIADSVVKLKKAIVMNGAVMNATENIMDGEFPCRKAIELQKKF